jgi:hypothetical protein
MLDKIRIRHGAVRTVVIKLVGHFNALTVFIALVKGFDIVFFDIVPGTIFITKIAV